MQFFIGGLHFLVAGLQLFIGGLQFLDRSLQTLFRELQFLPEPGFAFLEWGRRTRRRHLPYGSLVRPHRLKRHKEQPLEGLRLSQFPDSQVDQDNVAIGLHRDVVAHHFVFPAGRLMERSRQTVSQSFPSHLDQMVCGRAGRWFEIRAGVPVDVDHLAPGVDDDRCRRVARYQKLLDERGNGDGAH